MKTNPALAIFDRAVGAWKVTGSHPYLAGKTLPGEVTFERIEGGAFIRMHSKMEHPDIPEGVAIFGTDDHDDRCTMIYFDARGVARNYQVELRKDGFTWSRNTPEFSQRFAVTIAADGKTMKGEGKMKKEGSAEWEADLSLSYERVR